MFSKSITKLFFSVSLFIILVFPLKTFSYSDSTTHPALTDEIVDFFNLNFKDKILTVEEKEWVVRGVIEEDIMPRWINHFYDPTTGKGWTAEEMGRLSSSTAMALNKTLLSDQPPLNAKIWAEASDIQSKYKLFDGNRTWQRAVYELAKNDNRKEAFITLGHILHLLEDMTVPDHTRNDTHAHPLEGVTGDYGSPYEEYTKRYSRVVGGTNIPVNAELLFNQNLKPIVLVKLEDYFDRLSIYSNNHFFSKDTINRYNLPMIINNDGRYGYGRDDAGVFPLAYLKRIWNSEKFSFIDSYVLPSSDKDIKGDNKVLDAYFSRLSKEAIINGAGVIKLFFDEVEKVKSGEKMIEEPPKETSGIRSVLAVFKQVQNIYSTSVNFVSSFASNLLGIKIASNNNQVSSQTNSELDTQSNPTTPPELVNPPATIVAPPTPKPPTPALTPPTTPPLTTENILPTIQQPAVEPTLSNPPLPRPSGETPQQPKPSYILAVGYTPPAAPPAPPAAEENPVIFSNTPITTPTSTTEVATSTEPVATSTISVTTTIEISTTTISTTTTATTTIEITTSTISVTTTIDTATTTTSTQAIDSAPPEVVINEIAWAGTASTRANDEWFELYNNTDEDINLTDWKIFVSGQQIKIKINNKTIAARGYYLLERKEDSVISDIGADAIFTGSLNNDGEKMELFNPDGVKVDEVDTAGGPWFAGDKIKYRSMERLDATKDGSDPANWQSNLGARPTGQNVEWNPVYGSPRQSNFGYVMLSGLQEETVRTLDIKNSPYVVQYYWIPAGKTLNIDPDVSILLKTYGGMEIRGSLNALGEPDRRVNFLPYPSSTAWGTLKFINSTSTLNFVNVKKGDRITRLWQNLDGMLLAENSNLTINNSLIWDSEANAIGGTNSVFNISNSTIGASVKSNKTYGINTRGGILRLDNVLFNNVYVGVEAGNMAISPPVLEKKNMPNSNFINVDYIAEPLIWWNSVSSTTP